MTQTATRIHSDSRPVARASGFRPWIALAVAAILFAVVFFGVLPFLYVVPAIGVALALGAPPDYLGDARPVARRPRNVVLGAAMAAALAVVIWQPQLTLALVGLFGLDLSSLIVALLAVVVLALPLGMSDAEPEERASGWC